MSDTTWLLTGITAFPTKVSMKLHANTDGSFTHRCDTVLERGEATDKRIQDANLHKDTGHERSENTTTYRGASRVQSRKD